MDLMFHDLTITDADFQRLVRFIQEHYGIDLSKKRQLITSRLSQSLKSRGYHDFKSFWSICSPPRTRRIWSWFSTSSPPTIPTFSGRRITSRSSSKPFCRSWKSAIKRTRSWPSGARAVPAVKSPIPSPCASRTILVRRPNQWDTRVLATDISQQAMSKAQAAVYQPPADMPADWLRRYFIQDVPGSQYTVAPAIRSNVIFRTFNLMDPIRFRLKFDVIFCRNVMIYFDQRRGTG